MNVVLTSFISLLISTGLAVGGGWGRGRSGRTFLLEVFDGNGGLGDAVNRLLVVGFYLLNFGFVTLTMRTSGNIDSARQGLQLLSVKIGEVLLVLGALHFANLAVFARFRGRAQARALPVRPGAALQGPVWPTPPSRRAPSRPGPPSPRPPRT